jgi:hypothetical protein
MIEKIRNDTIFEYSNLILSMTLTAKEYDENLLDSDNRRRKSVSYFIYITLARNVVI